MWVRVNPVINVVMTKTQLHVSAKLLVDLTRTKMKVGKPPCKSSPRLTLFSEKNLLLLKNERLGKKK
jgi:hypothetical protein